MPSLSLDASVCFSFWPTFYWEKSLELCSACIGESGIPSVQILLFRMYFPSDKKSFVGTVGIVILGIRRTDVRL